MIEKDWLTGLYTAEVMEKKVESLLKSGKPGTLIITDICRFEHINKTYGHLNGDKLVQVFAIMLGKLDEEVDIIARIGPDIFALYFSGERDYKKVDQIKNKIIVALKRTTEETDIEEEVEAVTVATSGAAGEDSKKVFARAFLILTSEKRRGKRSRLSKEEREIYLKGDSSQRDMEIITSELREKESIKGAYLQNYESFKRIYQFVARGLERTKDTAYIMLLTLDSKDGGDALLPDEQEEMMELLYQVVKNELRRGDAFTQYSSCQYLLMVLSANRVNALKVGERIRKSFEQVVLYEYELILSYDVYPLKAPE